MQALQREIKKIASLALFFLIGFGYILLVMKLFLKEYEIDTYVLTKAIIGALIAAKAVVILDAMPWLNRFEQSPRYISVLYKTSIYTLGVLIIGAIEHLFHAYRETKAIAPAIEHFMKPENFYRFLAVTLCIAVVFFIHNIIKEIDLYLGKGKLKALFFGRS